MSKPYVQLIVVVIVVAHGAAHACLPSKPGQPAPMRIIERVQLGAAEAAKKATAIADVEVMSVGMHHSAGSFKRFVHIEARVIHHLNILTPSIIGVRFAENLRPVLMTSCDVVRDAWELTTGEKVRMYLVHPLAKEGEILPFELIRVEPIP